MKRLIIDTSSVLWMSLLAGKSNEFYEEVDFEGKKVWVNGWQYGLENAISHISAVARELGFMANQMLFVVEKGDSKANRIALSPLYKASRGKRPDQYYTQFTKCKDELISMFKAAGASVAIQSGVEGDDVIAYLVGKLDGEKVILSQDGDMAALMSDTVSLFRNGALLTSNPFGPFPTKYVTVYKALVGDSSDGYPGAKGFGDKAFMNLIVWGGGYGVLAAMEQFIVEGRLAELEEDVAEFKPLRKIIDNATTVATCYQLAQLRPDWVDTKRSPLVIEAGGTYSGQMDERVAAMKAVPDTSIADTIKPPKIKPDKHAVFDCELIGTKNPVFLVCMHVLETGERQSYWHHVEGDMARLKAALERPDLTWVSFNGIHFDAPLIWAALSGLNTVRLKQLANDIISTGKSFGMADTYSYSKSPEFDHIDLMEVSPGVKISLKAFAGRMHYKTMVDLPFDHDVDLDPSDYPVLESYCQNDLGVTEELFNRLRSEIDLRIEMGNQYGLELRSKSDAQIAEAVLKKAASIRSRPEVPASVTYKAPKFIGTDSDQIKEIIARLESHEFKINPATGSPETPEFLSDPIKLVYGTYQMGIGGLHSIHDKKLYVEADGEETLISDYDVSSFYPNIIMKAGLIPKLSDGKGEVFLQTYTDIYNKRMHAKRTGDKKTANALKTAINGSFGKLLSPYACFYSPDLGLAVTISGQLHLMSLIYDLEFCEEVKVISANTDGIMVKYPARLREKVLRRIKANAVRTGFEYEETRYKKVAMKDVNSYMAITSDEVPVIIQPDGQIVEAKAKGGVAKRKGLYTSTDPKENALYLMKNPSFEICSNAVVQFLKNGTPIEDTVRSCTDIRQFIAIRNVKGGAIQFDRIEEVGDWFEVEEDGVTPGEGTRLWTHPGRTAKPVKRKSPPPPREVGVGGVSVGRMARWYMSSESKLPINYVGSGNKVPQTDGARLCMTLPDELPADIDFFWYIEQANSILVDVGYKENP